MENKAHASEPYRPKKAHSSELFNVRLDSLRSTRDFESLRKDGRYFQPSNWLTVNYVRQDLSEVRCAWTISRTIAPAVIRNRFRRWGREFLRQWIKNRPALKKAVGIDFNLIFKRRDKEFYRQMKHADFDLVFEKLVRQFEKLS